MSALRETMAFLQRYKMRHGELPKRWFVSRLELAELKDEYNSMRFAPEAGSIEGLRIMGVLIVTRQ